MLALLCSQGAVSACARAWTSPLELPPATCAACVVSRSGQWRYGGHGEYVFFWRGKSSGDGY